MTDEAESERAAAICENCETIHAAHIGPEGDIRPIGTRQCTCEAGDLRIVRTDTDVLDEVSPETSQ